jgi:hypothetical protein
MIVLEVVVDGEFTPTVSEVKLVPSNPVAEAALKTVVGDAAINRWIGRTIAAAAAESTAVIANFFLVGFCMVESLERNKCVGTYGLPPTRCEASRRQVSF